MFHSGRPFSQSGGLRKIAPFSRTTLLPLVYCRALLGTRLPAPAATDSFVKFVGIDGSSVVKGHEKAIEFTSFDWGVSIPRPPIGGGGGVSKPVFKDFSWTQTLDSSVSGLFSSAVSGKAIKNAVVDFVVAGQTPQTYFRLTFDNVFLTFLDYSGSSSTPVELDGGFAYDKVTLNYWAQDKTGKFVPAGTAFYDLASGNRSVAGGTALFSRGVAGPHAALLPEPESYARLLAVLGLIGWIARGRFGV